MKLYLVLILSIFFCSEALARCNKYPFSTEEAFEWSNKVVLVSVNEARRLDSEPYNFEAKVKVIKPFKGNVKPEDIFQVNYKSEVHSILLTPGKTYVFFLNKANYVSICAGSQEYHWEMDKGALINNLTELSESGV